MSESEILRIDALGMRCPRPIVELAKVRRRVPSTSLIEITADDLAFESDVRAWCETTESTLVSLEKSGARITAIIRLPAENAA